MHLSDAVFIMKPGAFWQHSRRHRLSQSSWLNFSVPKWWTPRSCKAPFHLSYSTVSFVRDDRRWLSNRPFSSFKNPHFPNKGEWETFLVITLSSAEAPAGYHSKNSKNRKIESAWGTRPSCPARFLFFCSQFLTLGARFQLSAFWHRSWKSLSKEKERGWNLKGIDKYKGSLETK